MFIPRPGIGLHSLLDASGDRVFIGSIALAAGALQILSAYWRMCRVRSAVGVISMGVWLLLAFRFFSGGLYGGMLQAVVVMCFAGGSVFRLVGHSHVQHVSS